jgi:hypothetical protein
MTHWFLNLMTLLINKNSEFKNKDDRKFFDLKSF